MPIDSGSSQSRSSSLLATVRRPEYTGANRCVPCTAVNLVIAAVLATVAAIATPILGVGVAIVAVAAIWLRGYLIPGTPTLTRRYFPDRVLAWFDKADTVDPTPESFDVEATLLEAGVLVENAAGTDYVVESGFRRGWRERMRATDRERDRSSLAWLLDVEPDRLELEPTGEALVARVDGQHVGQWESRAAFVADIAAAGEFEARGGIWASLPTWARSELLGGLRLFIERCPTCDGDVVLEQAVKQSCCRNLDVLVLSCQACDARLFETPVDTDQLSALADEPGTDAPTAP